MRQPSRDRRAGPARTRRPVRALAILAALLLAGCTGGGSDGSGRSGGAGGGGAAPGGRSGGTLAIALLDPGPLDPARADGLEDEVVLGNLFDGLTTLDPAGAVRPAAAASWTADPSLRRWEFRLRPDARWSDGSPVRSGDFVFAWQRLADPKGQPPAGPRAGPGPSPARTLLAGVAGYRSFAAGRARTIAGLTTPDPATLVVRLDQPLADLPALVAALPLSPLPSARVRSAPAAFLARPVGNGPFRLAGPARPGRPLTLERNPAFWGSPPLLDRVSVHPVPDEQTAWLELQNGQVSFAPVPFDQLAAARTVYGASADGRSNPGLLQGPTLTSWQLTFNLRSKLARNRRWRQAVSLAVDRGRLAAALAGSAATGLVPPATPGWAVGGSGSGASGAGAGSGGAASPCTDCAHDLRKARSLLARAGSGRVPVTLAVPPGAEARRLADLLADDLAAAGVDLTATATPTGETPVTLVRRVAPYPRPDPFLAGPPSTSPQARRLLDQARATADEAARTTLYQQAEAAILADLRAAPLLTGHHAAVLAPGPQGFNLTPWGTLDLAAVSLPA